jgi:hypothetical protein
MNSRLANDWEGIYVRVPEYGLRYLHDLINHSIKSLAQLTGLINLTHLLIT